MKKQLWLMALLAVSAATLVACGDDTDDTPAPEDGGGSGGTGGDDDQDAGGAGGMGGSGGGGMGGTGGGGPVAMPVPCGSVTCQPPENPFGAFAGLLGGSGIMLPATGFACCRNEAAGECGYSMTEDGETCNEPAEPDARCPDFEIPIELPLPLPAIGVGCCVNNQCGVDGQLFGNGCTENDEARVMLGAQQIGMFLIDGVPPARACDAPPPVDGGDSGDVDEDAGH